MKQIQRQGDILFSKVAEVPKGARLVHEGPGYIVALGEATGHHHKLAVKEGQVKVFEASGIRYMEIQRVPGILTHQEHKEQILDPGVWEIGNEREFDYFMNEITRVQD